MLCMLAKKPLAENGFISLGNVMMKILKCATFLLERPILYAYTTNCAV
jgi:hypothetical protein